MVSRVRALSQLPMNAKGCLKSRLGALSPDMTTSLSNYGYNILNPKPKPNYHRRRLKHSTSPSHQALNFEFRWQVGVPKNFDLKWMSQSTWVSPLPQLSDSLEAVAEDKNQGAELAWKLGSTGIL
ncbi:hypothetical protein COLO4_21361 [Corchorus olitorius]|uniref:Uncharacterized protein n=1 Tax=Corchorus olitorius TaxID=93759 RepID=A0A1R3ITQ6_9ROSI|nr:hypothetical protein COLO4_21361 [Corchorus olitorius]